MGTTSYQTVQSPIANGSTVTPFLTEGCSTSDVLDMDNYLLKTLDSYKQSRYGALIMNATNATDTSYLVLANGSVSLHCLCALLMESLLLISSFDPTLSTPFTVSISICSFNFDFCRHITPGRPLQTWRIKQSFRLTPPSPLHI
jgi:hypothetical protein